MDTKLYPSILWEHSEYIGKVATELSAQLQQLTQPLNDQDGSAPIATEEYLDELVRLQQVLTAETEVFAKRLLAFIESTRPPLLSESPRLPAERSTPPLPPALSDSVIRRGTPSYAALTERAREVLNEARAAVTSAYQSYARSRQTLKSTEDLFQHLRARREREAERPPPLGIVPPPSLTAQASAAPPEPVPVGEPSPLTKETE